jgi:prefoldin subunit 5
LCELKNAIEDNLDKLTTKAEQFIIEKTEDIEDSLDQVENSAEDIWDEAKQFMEEATKKQPKTSSEDGV